MLSRGPIVGTAGHVDHGKTSLIRVLTGHDLDSLPEEKERGITIALGVVSTDIEGRSVAFIDVPGHDRLVRTMVAGATGIDAVLLCVSAIDGVMPQTIEHVGICQTLGITQGAIVLTMADQVDAELLELAQADVEDLVAGTFLQDKPVVPFSAVTGAGAQRISEVIHTFAPQVRPLDGPFRMPVDRVFSRAGFGAVVSGTVWSGTVRDDRPVLVLPSGQRARVRGLQIHGDAVEQAQAGQRLAVNLAGIDRDSLHRGVTLASEELPSSHVIDVRLHALPRSEPLTDGDPVRVLLGTSEAIGQVHFASERTQLSPHSSLLAQLRLDSPLTCLPGDRFIVRRPSPETTLAGGEVLDPWAPRMRRRDRLTTQAQLERLTNGERLVFLERAGDDGLTLVQARLRGVHEIGMPLGDRLFAPSVVGRLEGRVLTQLAEYHSRHPLSLGANRRQLHRAQVNHLPERVFDALIGRLAHTGMATVSGPLVHLRGFAVSLSDDEKSAQDTLFHAIDATGLQGVTSQELASDFPAAHTLALLHLLHTSERIERIEPLGWLSADRLTALVASVRGHFAHNRLMDPSTFKDLTGLSRRAAIPLLEWLDRRGVTERRDDSRVLRS